MKLLCITLLAICASAYAAELYHAPHSTGDYKMTYWQARELCKEHGGTLATAEELEEARKSGFSLCKCGWTLDRGAYFPMTTSVEGCGGRPALHHCDWRTTYDAYCYKGDSIGNCSKPLGMESNEISGSQLAASTEDTYWFPIFRPSRWRSQLARLHNYDTVNAWMPSLNGRHQWIQIDLEEPTAVTGIVTQGAKRLGKTYWVKSFVIQYSKDGHNYKSIKENEETKVFLGNVNNNGLKRNMFPEPILARYVRIYPHDWHGNIALRFELLGCDMETYKYAEAMSRDIMIMNTGGSEKVIEDNIFTERVPDDDAGK